MTPGTDRKDKKIIFDAAAVASAPSSIRSTPMTSRVVIMEQKLAFWKNAQEKFRRCILHYPRFRMNPFMQRKAQSDPDPAQMVLVVLSLTQSLVFLFDILLMRLRFVVHTIFDF